MALDAVSFRVSAAFLALIRRPERAAETAGASRSVRRDLAEGLRTLVGVYGVGNLFGGAIFAPHVLFMARTLGLPPAAIGGILSAAGPSALLGALLAGPLARRAGVGRTLVMGAVLFTAGDFCLALAGGPRAAAVALLVLSQALIGVGSPL